LGVTLKVGKPFQPTILQDFAGEPQTREALEYLSFQDWFQLQEHHRQDWIPVARRSDEGDTELFTFSALASCGAAQSNLATILQEAAWDVQLGFGKPHLYTKGRGKPRFNAGDSEKERRVEFRPFIHYRYFHGYQPWHFQLAEEFLLFHEAFWSKADGEYRRLDDDGVVHPVARVVSKGENRLVLADSHHLRDYLAARRCFLVRFHDHRRRSAVDIDPILKDESHSERLLGDDYHFELWLGTDLRGPIWPGSLSFSGLLGKDIVRPYPKPDPYHTRFADAKRPVESVDFVVGRSEEGTDELAPSVGGAFLTPVYFTPQVLADYYAEPSLYRVEPDYVRCLDLWGIPIDRTSEDLIQVWLGDLGRIPLREQLRWRRFNVPPRGTITRHRWRRDFMGEVADPEWDPVYYFRQAYERVNKAFAKKLGSPLFLALRPEDQHAYHSIRIPLSDEWKEFDEVLLALAKTIVDSLNVPLLNKQIPPQSLRQGSGTLPLVRQALTTWGYDEDHARELVAPLDAIQDLRSSASAHRKGERFERALRKWNLTGKSTLLIVATLLRLCTRSFGSIADALEVSTP
jgi:hypothetical protein